MQNGGSVRRCFRRGLITQRGEDDPTPSCRLGVGGQTGCGSGDAGITSFVTGLRRLRSCATRRRKRVYAGSCGDGSPLLVPDGGSPVWG